MEESGANKARLTRKTSHILCPTVALKIGLKPRTLVSKGTSSPSASLVFDLDDCNTHHCQWYGSAHETQKPANSKALLAHKHWCLVQTNDVWWTIADDIYKWLDRRPCQKATIACPDKSTANGSQPRRIDGPRPCGGNTTRKYRNTGLSERIGRARCVPPASQVLTRAPYRCLQTRGRLR
jgi:hypothetical protein